MKLLKFFGILITAATLLTLCACTSEPASPVQTTQAPAPIQTSSAVLPNVPGAGIVEIISYDVYYDEAIDCMLYSVSTLGEVKHEDGKIMQDNGKGAMLVSNVQDFDTDKTGSDLLEANIDRSKTILAEFGEEKFAFYESSDNGENVCYFGIMTDNGKTVNFTLTFPTDQRDTYFQHVSTLVQIYMDVYSEQTVE